jgi:hypothetical protein
MVAVSDAEQQGLDCSSIAAELGKARDYRNNVAMQGQVTSGRDVVSFLTDFGVGNTTEKEGALFSADQRIKQLRALSARKRCR